MTRKEFADKKMEKRYDIKVIEKDGNIIEIYVDANMDRAKKLADAIMREHDGGSAKFVTVFDGEELVYTA